MAQTDNHKAPGRLIWPLRLTWAGLWAERLTRAFWPVWTIAISVLAGLVFGVQDVLPVGVVRAGLVVALGGCFWFAWAGWRGFSRPTRGQALARMDAVLPGRPIAALSDRQAIGAGDPASAAVWRAHQERMARRVLAARAVAPDLRLSGRDRYALRYLALTALALALMFGSIWRVASVSGIGAGGGAALVAGPVWEGWVQPPVHTGKPGLYLNDILVDELALPVGSRVTLRLYGEVGALSVAETVSGGEVADGAAPSQGFEVARSGVVEISGPGGRAWRIEAVPDLAPKVAFSGEMVREGDGRFSQGFTASDDYGVVGGQAQIGLDLAAVDRRFGLAVEPEPREAVIIDLPMPITGGRAAFSETLVDDLSKHAFANLPVTIRLSAVDAAGHVGWSEPLAVVLPGKRFFDPMAAALIEMRRDLIWSRANGRRAVQVLRAVTHIPEGFIRNEGAYLRLRVAMRRLEAGVEQGLSGELRDELAEALWQIALLVEEGDLASALERLRRAQDRLSEAIRNGADPSEIDRLMAEMRDALDNYMRQLAQEAQQDPDQQNAGDGEQMEMSSDQLQQMLDELQKLMEEGRMAEAAELLEQLRQFMENMQVTQGEGGQGEPGQQAMRDLADTLREQQDLSDDAFRELQDRFNRPGAQGEGQPPGQPDQGQPGQGQPGQEGTGREGQGLGQPGQEGRGLAERQQELRDRLGGLGNLPGQGSEAGDAGRQALERAGRAMEGAEEALRRDDMAGALDRQAEAMEALREGMRELGNALAEDRRDAPDGQGEAFGQADPNSRRDPLGREPGASGRIGSDMNMLQGEDVYRRAQDLLDEIRRRSGEQSRPDLELDYLRRLLDRF